MTLKIDQAGRVILPKPIRDRFGLTAGAELEIQETADGLMLRPARRRSSLVTRDGLLLHRGTLPKGVDWNRLVEEDRADRIRNLGGQ
ncbi:MAG: AbrB/MazE/SpoVT family DNA-binding domain-containing protein [Bryobacterales bacterium]|nr:AbrB/MazE/SpoVT family DNA-binding domain-containing protein [Bryobacterales bacterium]